MAPLQVARKDDARIGRLHDLPGVDVAEREVVVAAGCQRRHAGRCVGIVVGAAGQAGVQHADVEQTRHRRVVAGHEVFVDGTLRKAAAMQRHAEVVEADGLAAARAEQMHALDRGQLAGDLALGVVVALGDEDPHAGPRQTNELLTKEQAGPEVLPVAIEDVAGQHDQVDAPLDGGRHQPQEGLPGRAAQPLQRSARVLVQALQGAVDVQVGGVDELHGIGMAGDAVPQCATRGALCRRARTEAGGSAGRLG
jgi:hypothetical protein